jgi:hypothetical protein
MNKFKALAAKYDFTLWYDRSLQLWALTDNKGQKDAYYFTKHLIASVTLEEFENFHFKD